MIDTQNGYSRVEVALKAALVVSALGFIVMVADRSHSVPSEAHRIAAASTAAPDRATTTGDDQATSAGREANGAPAKLYPDLSPDAASDEGGHPPSF